MYLNISSSCVIMRWKGGFEMPTTSDRLKQIMGERNLKQVDILKLTEPFCSKYKIKLGKSDLSQFVSGKVVPGQWKLSILGMALDVSEGWLMGLDVPREREYNSFSPKYRWESKLREAVCAKASTIDAADWEAACIPPQELDEVLAKDQLSFDQGCELAHMFGISIDNVILEDNTPTHMDERTDEVIRLYAGLDPDHQQMLVHVLRGLLADQAAHPDAQA